MTCKYCSHGGDWCGEEHDKEGFVCTRVEGHRGQHVACGHVTDCELHTWENEVDYDDLRADLINENHEGKSIVSEVDIDWDVWDRCVEVNGESNGSVLVSPQQLQNFAQKVNLAAHNNGAVRIVASEHLPLVAVLPDGTEIALAPRISNRAP